MSSQRFTGRNLRMLVINDEGQVPSIPNIEVVACSSPFNTEKEIFRIGEWRQHLWMWMTQDIPTFDFLLVDIRFHKDSSDPTYFNETTDQVANPLGLLHALPLVGQLTSSRMPFVWGIHSSAKEAVVDDPVATICYGLLCAMDHANEPDAELEEAFKEKRANVSGFIRSKLLNDQSVTSDPEGTVRSLVGKYRKVFNSACRDKLALTHGVIDEMCSVAQDFLNAKEGIEKLQAKSIGVGNGLMTDEISLRSYFADVSEWTPDTVRHVILPELRKLQSTQEYTDIYPIVVKCMDMLDPDAENGPNAANVIAQHVQPNDKDRYGRVCVAVILCACLRLLHNQWRLEGRAGSPPKFETHLLANELGYFGQYQMKWPDNRLKTFYGGLMRPTTFRDMLVKKMDLHPILRQCGVKYWARLNNAWKNTQLEAKVRESEVQQFRLPDCLNDPAVYDAS